MKCWDGQEYKGTGRKEFKIMPRRTWREMLNLLEVLIWKKRKTIRNEFSLRKWDVTKYDDVVKYIKTKYENKSVDEEVTMDELVEMEKQEIWLASEQMWPKLTPAQQFMVDIERKANEKLAIKKEVVETPTIINGVYAPKTDKYWFFEE